MVNEPRLSPARFCPSGGNLPALQRQHRMTAGVQQFRGQVLFEVRALKRSASRPTIGTFSTRVMVGISGGGGGRASDPGTHIQVFG